MANAHISITTAAPRATDALQLKALGVSFRSQLRQLKGSLAQYGADAAGYAAVEADFGLASGAGSAFVGLVSSSADESTGAATGTFIAQLLDRLG